MIKYRHNEHKNLVGGCELPAVLGHLVDREPMVKPT
jgi:hypothetical protein